MPTVATPSPGITQEQLLDAVDRLARAKETKGQRSRNREISFVMRLLADEHQRRRDLLLAQARAIVAASDALAQQPAAAPGPIPEEPLEQGFVRADQLRAGDRLLDVSHAKLNLDAIALDLPLRIESATRPDRHSPIITVAGEDRVMTLPAAARCVVEHGA